MKTSTLSSIALALPALTAASKHKPPKTCKKLVDSESLQELVTLDGLLAGSQKLQDIADANGGTRVFGSTGHNATVDYIYDTLKATGYFTVTKQPFTEIFASASGSVAVDGKDTAFTPMTYTPGGEYSGPLVLAPGLGCEVTDYPAEVKGAAALIQRGTCTFGQKATSAKAAGAAALLVYNNEPGELSGTLGEPFGEYAPVVGISLEDGEALVASLEAGEVNIDFKLDAVIEDRVNFNVIAETKKGDHDNVLVIGGHSDSVTAGPGINDDGSGIIGVLNVALGLTKFSVKNAVRFGFWGAEEYGLLGSYAYIKSINGTEGELAKIRAYLNFDMIASPNYILGVYDGDGSAFNTTGPAGSDVLEQDFVDFYKANGFGSVPSEFDGRSDYGPFIENGIASGGLFTGAEGIMTDEEAELFGGKAGVAYDVNYHGPGDTIDNLSHDAFLLNTKSIANSVAKYAVSWDSFPTVDLAKRGWTEKSSKTIKKREHSHAPGSGHTGACGGGVPI
ncbi:related to aminopeptidase Y precursor, vacuolar [Cephalotrichum gorgonifer]|uniref:Peptide hydrolase n=1 Tax=Cephalotrichum gorgonifer TaxID=2041049 RepID=A0AAE8MRS8_9PEZI|nr:related to aminopeptidase Y precursor, vacuolar [Cephalotrichum gorgonifer]